MSFAQEYRDKRVGAAEAVKLVNSGDIVDYGFFNGKPVLLDEALAARAAELRDVGVFTAVTLPPVPAVFNFPESFKYVDWQWSKLTRMLHNHVGTAYYCPIMYHRGPFYYRELLTQDPKENLSPSFRSFYYVKAPQRNAFAAASLFLQPYSVAFYSITLSAEDNSS